MPRESSNGRAIADVLVARAAAAPDVQEPAAAGRAIPDFDGGPDHVDLMFADAVLPETVRPPQDAWARTSDLTQARHVLLTGATGFLGRWLAKTLLERSAATLSCMVRAGRGEPAARLWQSLSIAGIEREAFDRRVRVVEGNLSRPALGMSPSEIGHLSHEVDAICHAGAKVNWVPPYAALRAANVVSTGDLLALAARRGAAFHFVSSLSVCHSTLAPRTVDEEFDALTALGGLHFGYAQTKAVAEALVLQAGARGLPVTIHRPSLIAGHSASGAYNDDDLLARVVSGCVRMGSAPDLDWTLDCVPVDTAADEIVRLSHRRGVVHIAHPRPRHWRECALWMRLYGYDLRLVPYHAWLRQLDRETMVDRSHPLAPLRSFFLERPPDAGGLTLPELMLRTAASAGTSSPTQPDLDAPLLQRYFDAFVARGDLDATSRTGSRRAGDRPDVDAAFFAKALGRPVTGAEFLSRLSDHSIISELTAWSSGRPTGLFRYRLEGLAPDDASHGEVVVKIKPSDRTTIGVGESVARLCGDRLGDAYARWSQRTGLASAHVRELAVYEQRDARFTRHAPRMLGTIADPSTGDVDARARVPLERPAARFRRPP